MPAWILSALRLIGTMGMGYVAGQAVESLPPGSPGSQMVPGGGGGGGGIMGQILPGRSSPGYMDHHGRWHSGFHRRRRRRALTAGDRADIAFIAGLLGPSAGAKFAAVIGAK